jgi:AraC-like DNA-binding protein
VDFTKGNRFRKVTTRPKWEGILFTDVDFADQRILISASEPADLLTDYIEYIWYMRWDIPKGDALRCIVAPNPCSKLVVLQHDNVTYRPLIIGTKNESDVFELRGAGTTIGIDFKPGGLFPFLGKSMTDWPAEGTKAAELFNDIPLVSEELWTEFSLTKWLNQMENFLTKHLSNLHENRYKQINFLIDGVLKKALTTPEEIAQEAGVSVRTLQRIFREEVGISPRDLLRIARFNEAIRQISQDDFKTFVDVALESGFFDQPHMVNEFQKLAATPPTKFRRYL